MKPDWKDAPEWAGWLVMDGDRYWFWHEHKPEFMPADGLHYDWWRQPNGGRTQIAQPAVVSAIDSQESRP